MPHRALPPRLDTAAITFSAEVAAFRREIEVSRSVRYKLASEPDRIDAVMSDETFEAIKPFITCLAGYSNPS